MKIRPATILFFLFICAIAFSGGNALRQKVDSWRGDPTDPDQVADGKIHYANHCASCHGSDLKGAPQWRAPEPDGTPKAPPLDQTGPAWKKTNVWLINVIHKGGAIVAPRGAKTGMPAFEDKLDESDIWDILAFIKNQWPDDVIAQQNALNKN